MQLVWRTLKITDIPPAFPGAGLLCGVIKKRQNQRAGVGKGASWSSAVPRSLWVCLCLWVHECVHVWCLCACLCIVVLTFWERKRWQGTSWRWQWVLSQNSHHMSSMDFWKGEIYTHALSYACNNGYVYISIYGCVCVYIVILYMHGCIRIYTYIML